MRIQYFIIICQDKLVSFFKYVNISYKFESYKVLKVQLSKLLIKFNKVTYLKKDTS